MTFRGTLYPFQVEAKDMMLSRGSLLLAHGLGMGKTITSIAACEELIDRGAVECVLVICPASLKWQWSRQLHNFTDGALVKVIEGTKGDRRAQYRGVKRGDYEYVICNYEQIVADWDIHRHLLFDVVVCDEIVAIKNPGAKRSRHVKRITAPYKFGLSGQPIENKPEELFSIMQWLDPEVLGDHTMFDKTFIVRNSWGSVKHYRNLRTLRTRMTKAMHRVTRHEVADQMPAVVEKSYVIDMDAASLRLYRHIVDELLKVIASAPKIGGFNLANHYHGVDDGGAMGEIMPRLMALRMLCDHPQLLTYSADNFDDPDTKMGSAYASGLQSAGMLEGLNFKSSPKLKETLILIDEFLDADPLNKVVLFSFFKPMLRLLQSGCKWDSEMYTGDLTPHERDDAVQRFQTDPRCRVFFSSDAGGIGVDIPAGNLLISYDLPWSAGKWEQRNGRIIRISSEWPEVTLVSMLMRDSIEERMYDMLETKSQIASAWLDGEGVDAQGQFHLTLGTLAGFLSDRHR